MEDEKVEYINLGRTGLHVSRICLGTMNFGAVTEEKEAFRIMDAALDAGINFIDTANNYGQIVGKMGITETIIGRWFAQGDGREPFWQRRYMRIWGSHMTVLIPFQDFQHIRYADI